MQNYLPNRKTARASWHNYNHADYFVTICTKNRGQYFGSVVNGEIHLTRIGQYLWQQLTNVQSHYPYAEIPLFVIMPDHVHLIVSVHHEDAARDTPTMTDAARDVPTTVTTVTGKNDKMRHVANKQGWLSVCVGGIKSAVTKYANENKIPFAWQSRFHDRIIRNNDEKQRIAKYIQNNPANWTL